MQGLRLFILGLTLLGAGTAQAATQCPGNPDALGTSRTIVVDPTEHPRVGGMQYRESLPLEDHEIVLTFDDGPLPPRSSRILDILASECVKATYFMVGRMAHSFPDMVRRIRDAGHTIGTHSESHPLTFHKMPLDKAIAEINGGIESVTAALGDGTAPAPFFRIPGLLRAEPVERYLASQHLMVWSADFPADDWTKISPAQVFARALQRIEAHHKGILLLHDIQPRTVEALPGLLRELKRRGYRIVHVVPATPELAKTATNTQQWVVHARQIWPQTAIYPEDEEEPALPAPSPASFGMSTTFDPRSGAPVSLQRARTIVARGQIPLPPHPVWPRSLDAPPVMPQSALRTLLPAPSPQSFGYPGDAPTPWLRGKVSSKTPPVGTASATTGAAIEPRRSVSGVAAPDDGPATTGSVPRLSLRETIPAATMPRGAFP